MYTYVCIYTCMLFNTLLVSTSLCTYPASSIHNLSQSQLKSLTNIYAHSIARLGVIKLISSSMISKRKKICKLM